jgi:hypothetical protein
MKQPDTSQANRDTLNADGIRELMEYWFRLNYEDPTERTPYESAEGGYIWIWGGPFETREVLEEEFSGKVDDELIEELASELDNECLEWAPTPQPGDYDDYIVDDISSITEFHHNFGSAILDIEKLLATDVPDPVVHNFNRLLYLNVVIALETYLSDAFINMVMSDGDLFNKFVENTPEFQQRKIPLSSVIKEAKTIELTAKTHLLEISWHNLARVSKMYESILGIKFPDDLGDLFRAVLKRHDIVHRNGMDKDGNEIPISIDEIRELIRTVENFTLNIDQQLPDDDEL